MLFNSIEFAIFLPIVFLLYWFVFDYWMAKCKYQLLFQNLFIVGVSYLFYGWWDWKFLLLIAFTSLCSYASGLGIKHYQDQGKKKPAKVISALNIILNLAILGIFKYYDFFVNSFAELFHINGESLLLNLILPVGISFYTFQALSYSIDVYRQKIEPTKNIVAFFAFISFFPQLVAGPIERATNLLPQFLKKRTFDYNQAIDGLKQILWGLFKKMVMADSCALFVDKVFDNYSILAGSTLLLAAILFAVQIYGDFSGYSDIAIGTAKLFGIKLMQNFNCPYFSRDIAEFWRKWHISLTTWFRDYVYIPCGGSRPNIPDSIHHKEAYKRAIIVRNTFIIFLLSGFWHGANWTFVCWGAYHALLFLPLILLGKNRKYTNIIASRQLADGSTKLKFLPSFKEFLQIIVTFFLVVIGWILFRADSIHEAFDYIRILFTNQLLSIPYFLIVPELDVVIAIFLSITITAIVEWLHRDKQHGLQQSGPKKKYQRVLEGILYYCIFLILVLFSASRETFIYFQF